MIDPSLGGSATTRHDRAALGVIATYLHELTEHGRPRDEDADGDARVALRTVTREVDDDLGDALETA